MENANVGEGEREVIKDNSKIIKRKKKKIHLNGLDVDSGLVLQQPTD